jgi:ABC-type phosphate transport system substrate-binding protein
MRVVTRKRTAVAVAAAGLLVPSGCNSLIDANGYYELARSTPDAATVAPDVAVTADGCVTATHRDALESACTTSACVAYTAVLPTCDAGLCALPPASMTTTVGDAATPDASAAPDGSTSPGVGASTDGGPSTTDGGPSTSCSHVRADPSTIVYVTGSTALAGFISEVASALASSVAIVYQGSGSCVGVRSALDPGDNVLSSANGAATYYTTSGVEETCVLDPAEGLVADVGASDVFYSTCYLGQSAQPPLPASVGENFGPVQIMNFAVPQSSTQQSISLTAAYYVFGFGGSTYPVAPWVDPSQLQIRNANSGTQSLIAAAIGVPPDAWKGVQHGTSAQVGTALVAAGQSGTQRVVDSALGILASDYLIQNAQTLRGLAVKDENANCAYYPDSTAFARDNANARDGHYPLWGPSHFYARVDPSTNLPLKAGVSQFIDGLNGLTALPGLDLVAEYASKGLIPECAMHVTRANDGGDYTPFKAPVTCNCYFDFHATGTTSCKPCGANSDCPGSSPNCNKFGPQPQQGYCDL